MRHLYKFLIAAAGVFFFFLFISGCKKSHLEAYTYQIQTPILMEKSVYFGSINGNTSEPVTNGGRIYVTGNYIFVNDIEKGIHVIDNADPQHPEQVAFLNIPGNLGMVVKGNTLLADKYNDLLAIDISDIKHVKITDMVENFFMTRSIGVSFDSTHVIVGYLTRDTTVYIETEPRRACLFCKSDPVPIMSAFADNSPKPVPTGQAGSMAGMVLMKDYLYAITEPHSVGIVDVSDPQKPQFKMSYNAGFDLETIFTFKDNLLLGATMGMFIYNVSDPLNPAKLGEFYHGFACDPVIADGNTAYVTLHSGSSCGGSANELNTVDITDLMHPTLIRTYPMTSPKGLAKDGDLLFVCDGESGVKVLDAKDAKHVELKQTIDVKDAYDVIALGGLLIVVAKDGIYQFDYADLNNIRALSSFKVPHKET